MGVGVSVDGGAWVDGGACVDGAGSGDGGGSAGGGGGGAAGGGACTVCVRVRGAGTSMTVLVGGGAWFSSIGAELSA